MRYETITAPRESPNYGWEDIKLSRRIESNALPKTKMGSQNSCIKVSQSKDVLASRN
jgi:hypothetical protein